MSVWRLLLVMRYAGWSEEEIESRMAVTWPTKWRW